MKNALSKTLAALAVASAISTVAMADPYITGGIGFASSLATNPAVTLVPDGSNYEASFFGAQLTSASGTFDAVVPFATQADSSFQVSSLILSGPNPAFTSAVLVSSDLWTFTANSVTYTFDPTTVTVTDVIGSDGSITAWGIAGNGTFSAGGFNDTSGIYDLTFNATGVTSFSATTNASPVPDGGTTSLMVGLGLLGLGLYARRNRLAKA